MQVLGLIFTEAATGKKLAYFTDCKLISRLAREMASGADLVVLDGLRPETHPTHMSLPEAVTAASEMKNEMTYITHMTYKVDHDITESKLPKNVRLAYDGLRIIL
jgi:phosphoribosyl 1,2-cyclic phosphate phosphodiesterase